MSLTPFSGPSSGYRRPFRFRIGNGSSITSRTDPDPSRLSFQITVRGENGHEGAHELEGPLEDLRLEEPKNTTMPLKSSSVMLVPSVKSSTSDEDLPRILECPVCYNIPENEVFNCEKGHSVCGKCRLRLSRCALCASAFNGSRNFLVESLISYYKKVGFGFSLERTNKPSTSKSEIAVTCPHKYDGCHAVVPCSGIDDHARVCECRPVSCIACLLIRVAGPKSIVMLKLSDYFCHLRGKHNIMGLSEPSGVFMKTDRLFMGLEVNTSWLPFYLQYDGKIFVRNAALKNRRVSWWIQLIGPDSDSRKYSATISLQNPKNPSFKISWTTPVFAIRCDEKTIDQKNIATISTARILPFCTFNEQFEDRDVTHAWNCQIILSRVY